MNTQEQNSGASLDELLSKLQDVELALHSLNTDLKGSQEFKRQIAGLAAHTHLMKASEAFKEKMVGRQPHARPTNAKAGAVFVTPDQEKCLRLIERYFDVYRRYLRSPLGDEFSGGPENRRPE